MRDPVQVFEHDLLRVGEQSLTQERFDALVRFNQRHGDRFFTVRHRCLLFGSYVGVMKVGHLTIEVLPKVDRSATSDTRLWRDVLVEMLRRSGYLPVRLPTWAELHVSKTSLLDLYLEAFLGEVDELTHHGLVRRYRRERASLPALKGRLLFTENILRNAFHKERFFVECDRYDRDNVLNRILKRAVSITASAAGTLEMRGRAQFLADSFESVSDVQITEATFEHLRFDRKTERYRRALMLAKLIILNYQPDVRVGSESVLAILCDMNQLFEEYVYRQLKRAAARRTGVRVQGQRSHLFWQTEHVERRIRPDIEIESDDIEGRMVLDTKWKVPGKLYPSDDDLKQMFAYNTRLSCRRSILLYPRTDDRRDVSGWFISHETGYVSAGDCEMLFIDLLEDRGLRRDLGDAILARLAV